MNLEFNRTCEKSPSFLVFQNRQFIVKFISQNDQFKMLFLLILFKFMLWGGQIRPFLDTFGVIFQDGDGDPRQYCEITEIPTLSKDGASPSHLITLNFFLLKMLLINEMNLERRIDSFEITEIILRSFFLLLQRKTTFYYKILWSYTSSFLN